MTADDQVITGEAVALELRTAGAGSRGIAALMDLAVTLAALLVLLIVVGAVGNSVNSATAAALALVTLIGVVLGYPVAMETLWHGRTLGKAAMGLRVVRDDGGPIRFRHALVRGLVGVVIDKPGISLAFLAVVPITVSARHKRVGDMFAGTVVLSERIPGSYDVPVTMPAPLAGWAASLDLAGVDGALALRARQLVMRSGQLSPDALQRLQHNAVGELVDRVGPPPAGAPDWAVLAAVVAERRRRALAASTPPGPRPGTDRTSSNRSSIDRTPAAAPQPASEPPSTSGFAPPA